MKQLDDKDRHWLQRVAAGISFEEPMERHTSLKVGGPADALVKVATIEALAGVIRYCREKSLPVRVIGAGTNLLVKDAGVRGVVIKLSGSLARVSVSDTTLSAGAGTRLAALCRTALAHGLAGMGFALGIPGSVGGAVVMNAGIPAASMASVLSSVILLDDREQPVEVPRKDLRFAYRRTDFGRRMQDGNIPPVIVAATVTLRRGRREDLRREAIDRLRRRKAIQPITAASAGSFFKNPAGELSAGELIDRAGLKGTSIGGARISARHANFIINSGTATATDITRLMALVQRRVAEKFSIALEPEVQIIGD